MRFPARVFTPGRDDSGGVPVDDDPMNAVVAPIRSSLAASELLLRHCLALGGTGRDQRPATARLEEAVGPELARRLIASATVPCRRRRGPRNAHR
jgi:hypothetical protein